MQCLIAVPTVLCTKLETDSKKGRMTATGESDDRRIKVGESFHKALLPVDFGSTISKIHELTIVM